MKVFYVLVTLLLIAGQCFALPSPEITGGAGAGYEDNLNHSASAGSREGDTFGSAWLGGGISKEILKNHTLFLRLAYSGSYFQTYHDLTVNSISLKTGLMLNAGDSHLISLSAGAGKNRYGDSDRDADEVFLSLSFSSILSSQLTARAVYEHINHNAEESFFSYKADSLTGGCQFRLSERTSLSAAYSLEYSETTFYVDSSSPMPAHGKNGHSATFGSGQLAVSDDSESHIISIDAEHRFLNSNIYFILSYRHYRTVSDLENFQNNRVFGALGLDY